MDVGASGGASTQSQLSHDKLGLVPGLLQRELEWERPWERVRSAPGLAIDDPLALARVSEQLSLFARTLSGTEQAALRAMLEMASGAAPFVALAAEPAEAILDSQERGIYERLREEPLPDGGLRPVTHLIMKGTRLCNLRCTYCNFWREGPNQIMRFPVLARVIRDALRDPGVRHVEFIWHGGETTLLPIAFYKKALWLQEQFRRPSQVVRNRIQTNATRLTDEWLEFWRRYQFIVGVSLDGPPEVHDRRRIDKQGAPTAARVRAGLERLNAAGLDPRVLMVVDDDVVDLGAERVLKYLLEVGVTRVGVLNVVPENTPDGAPPAGAYLSWTRYIDFLRDLFQLWWPDHVDRIVVRELADLASQLIGQAPLLCNFAGDCFGSVFTIEPNGDVSHCDRYVNDETYIFGNVLKSGLSTLPSSPRLVNVRAENAAAVDRTRACPWFAVCHGGCPHDRRVSEQRVPGWDDRCCGVAPLLAEMAETIRAAGLPVYTPAHAPLSS